ncbi:MAG: HlyD family efflux transporter periplasmic adaptor subunit [Calditrichaeota bacterium]|nr:MAG: HlyD family efflux transporter periplasmic adaptor subunit [Calditrichota bacterium]
MFFRKFRQTHHFNYYTILWLFGFALFLILIPDWYIAKKSIGVVENKSHQLSVGESGRLQSVLVSIGEQVEKDQVLMLLNISDLKSNLEQMKTELAAFRKYQDAHQDRSALEIRRMVLQMENEAADLAERLSLIESQSAELAALNAEIERLQSAESAGLGYSRSMSELIVQRDALSAFLQEQGKDIELYRQNLEQARQSRALVDGTDMESMTNSLAREQMQYAEELRRLVAETEYRIGLRTIVSPCDGVVTEILARAGDAVDEFIPLIVVDESSPLYMDVYISEQSPLIPQVGMKVKIYSSRDRKFNATGTISFVHPGFSMASERFSYRGQFFWARKVRVELPAGHQLIPGEVVKVRLNR